MRVELDVWPGASAGGRGCVGGAGVRLSSGGGVSLRERKKIKNKMIAKAVEQLQMMKVKQRNKTLDLRQDRIKGKRGDDDVKQNKTR